MDRRIAKAVQKALIADRERVGLRQRDVAEKAGLGQAQISRFENGEQEPTFDELAALAVVFGRVLADYFTGTETPARADDPLFERLCVVWARMDRTQHEHWVGFAESSVPKLDRPKGRKPRRRTTPAKRKGGPGHRPRAGESDE